MDFNLESSVLFKRIDEQLCQCIDIAVTGNSEQQATLRLHGKDLSLEEKISLDSKRHFFLPEIRKPLKCQATLQVGEERVTKEVTLLPQRKWQVHVVHFSHTDTGYTDLPSRIARNHGRFLRQVLEFCRETDDFPNDAKFRWSIETGYQFRNGWARLSPEEQQEIIQRIREGRIELTPIYLAHNTELYDHEVLLRTVLYVTEFCRQHGIEIKSAMNTDINGQPWALPQLLARSGIRYLAMGVNPTRGRAPKVPRPFYWESQDGSRILVWDTDPNNAYVEGATLGFVTGYEVVLDKLPRYLKRYTGEEFPYDVIGFRTAGQHADNAGPVEEISEIVKTWNQAWEFPRVIMSTNGRFMNALKERWGDKFPIYRQAWPDYWIDTFGAVARETAVCRKAHEAFNIGEKLSALVSLYDKDFRYPKEEIDEALNNILLADEVDWCAAESQSNPDSLQSKGQFYEQASFAYRAAITAEEVFLLGQTGIIPLIKSQKHRIVVFNPLSWSRSDLVRVNIPKKVLRGKFPMIRDAQGNSVAYQQVDEGPLTKEFAFVAHHVPPLGYRSYAFELTDKQPVFSQNIQANSHSLENRFYRVVFGRDGTIDSIYDKDAKRELVQPNSEYGFYQIIYEETVGGRAPVTRDKMADEEKRWAVDLDFMPYGRTIFPERFPDRDTRFNRLCPTPVEMLRPSKGPVFSGLTNRSSIPKLPRIDRTIILYDDLKRIDLVTSLDKTEVREAEALYLAFPFALQNFQVEIENAYSFLTPETGQLPGSCRDWYLTQKWIRLFDPDFGIVWSAMEAPLVQLSEIQTGRWLHNLELKNSTIYSWLFNNYWWTNIPASQGGWNYRFQYSMASHTGYQNRLEAIRFGWNHHSPLRGWFIAEEQKEAVLPEEKFSLCETNAPNVIISAMKRAENGEGIVLRLFEVEGKPTRVTLSWHGPRLKKAFLTNPVEQNLQDLDCQGKEIVVHVEPYEIVTLRMLDV